MRRNPDTLLPLEHSILEAALHLRRQGIEEVHGFLLAKVIRDRAQARLLTGYGTLYKALERLEQRGFLESRWEAPDRAASERRPRRRYYRLTLVGETALSSPRADTVRRTSRAATPEVAM